MTRLGHEIERARKAALWYKRLGCNPLPARTDQKSPTIPYVELWDTPTSESLYGERTWDTPNVQLMLGSRWHLCVLDLDGEEAAGALRRIRGEREIPRTWAARTPSGGLHLYFGLPAGAAPLAPCRRLWGLWDTSLYEGRGGWRHHQAIELLGDHALVMAPPSFQCGEGVPLLDRPRYRFLSGWNPREVERPALCPDWLLKLPPVRGPEPAPIPPRPPASALLTRSAGGPIFDWESVQRAIPDKRALAEAWGLRMASETENRAGWMRCRSLYREDRCPSASFSPATGVYWERDLETGKDLYLSIFQIAIARGKYPNFYEAVQHLGSVYLGRH